MIENGTILQDRYLIEKQIGAGGMGAVYLAVDQRFGNHVALKETFYKDEEFGAAFEREAKLLNGLHHSALPHVSDYFTEGGEHFLVMQYIEGEDLSEVLKRDGAFPVEIVLRWADNLLDALDYLHSQEPPIIHRDIKPQNLKINTRGEVILLDFGLAKVKSEDSTAAQQSVFGYSRKYSPLEQIQGVGTDARSDIFSLAATLYHLLTGAPPIDALARAAEIVAGNPDPLELAFQINDQVPQDVARILHNALALNAAARYDSAKSMRETLHVAIANVESSEKAKESEENIVAAPIAASPETENFPALEAFVAEVGDVTSVNSKYDRDFAPNEFVAAENSNPIAVLPNSVFAEDAPTRVATRVKKSRLPFAALVALLICAALTVGYFVSRENSSGNAQSEEQKIQSSAAPELKAEQQAETAAASPEITDSATVEPPKDARQTAMKTATAIEDPIEKNDVAGKSDTSDTVEKSKIGRPKADVVRQTKSISNERRSESERSGETRSRVVENQSLPDIESIFTGRPSSQRSGEMRRRREELPDEEIREMRRRRRQERRRQQNRSTFPPF